MSPLQQPVGNVDWLQLPTLVAWMHSMACPYSIYFQTLEAVKVFTGWVFFTMSNHWQVSTETEACYQPKQ